MRIAISPNLGAQMTNFDIERLRDEISRELLTLRSALLEEFEEAMRGKQASHRKAGRILKLIVHAPRSTAEGDGFAASESIDVLVIVNHRELADKDQHWRHALARLRRDRERGVLPREIRLDVHCLQDVNRALVSGLPYLASIVRRGIVLYELDRTPLATPRNLPSDERCWRGRAEFERWYPRAEDFLSGASFYRDEGNMRMAALLLHQACEHLYQCVFWTVMLHGRRTHSLDELRGLAEGLDERLRSVWPRTSRFERRCFAQVRRAYVEARYEPSFPITAREIGWMMERVAMLYRRVGNFCRGHLSGLQASSVVSD